MGLAGKNDSYGPSQMAFSLVIVLRLNNILGLLKPMLICEICVNWNFVGPWILNLFFSSYFKSTCLKIINVI